MGDRSLPPKVDGHPQGRLDLIFGRPALFPPAKATQSYIFTFRWWGDTRPCILRLPPEKSEARITYYVTCGPHSFRQYLCDSKSLHVNLKIGGGDNVESAEDERLFGRQMQSPRKVECDTPRQRLLRRQLRLKKGWQDGDAIGNFILPDLKLNSRGDYVYEGRIIDSSADIIGTVVVTMVFLKGTLEDFQQIKIQNEEQTFLKENITKEKTDDTRSKSRASGIPVLGSHGGKSLKASPEGNKPRSRSGSFRESLRQKCERLKSPKKPQQNEYNYGTLEKENQAPHRKRAGSFTMVGREGTTQHDQLSVKRHDSVQAGRKDGSQIKERNNSHLVQGSFAEFQEEGLQVGKEDSSRLMQQANSQVEHEENAQVMSYGSPQVMRRVIPKLTPRKNSYTIQQDSPQIIRRDRKHQDGNFTRERPASWGLYPLLSGADPHSLVDSGAVKAEDLPIFLQVLEGRSPNLDLSNLDVESQKLDPESRKLLDGLDLSRSFSNISTESSGNEYSHTREPDSENRTARVKSPLYSVFKSHENDSSNLSGVSMTSGIWPLEQRKGTEEKSTSFAPTTVVDKIISQDSSKFGSPRRVQQGLSGRTKIPTSQVNRTPVKACRTLLSQTFTDKKPPSPVKDLYINSEGSEEHLKYEKIAPSKYGSEDDGSVLVIDIGTLTLSPPLLPPKPPNNADKVSGVRVMHRSRVCYLTTLDVNLPGLDIPPEWEMAQTCASRQLVDHEIHYNVREVLKLPPASAVEVLRGHLIVRCLCRRLGERESEEVGSASVSLMELWQLNGSQVNVPLFRSHLNANQDSLTRRQGKKNKKREDEYKEESLARLTIIARLGLAVGRATSQKDGKVESLDGLSKPLKTKTMSKMELSDMNEDFTKCLRGKLLVASKSSEDNLYSEKFAEREETEIFLDSSPYSKFSDSRHTRQQVHHLKPRIIVDDEPESAFDSIYAPTHVSPHEKLSRGVWQYPVSQGRVDIVDSILATPLETKLVNCNDAPYSSYHGSFLNGYDNPSNQPVESGGESPCIRTASEFTADFINYDTLSQKPGIELRREERGGTCRIHLEILKGRNLPLLEGPDGTPRPPNSYVRTTIGSYNILTNVCQESDNPLWSFATDVLLPYSQLTQTDGSLILKVHHTQVCQRTSVDDLLLGFVCVDATSIWSGHVSLCGWYPLLDLRGAVRGHVKVSLTPHEPPQTITPTSHWFSVSLQEHTSYYPPSSLCQSRHSYPQSQYTTHREPQSDPQHICSRSDTGSASGAPLGRSPSPFSQLSPRSRRRNYSQTGHNIQDHSAMEISSISKQNLESSSCINFHSVVGSGSATDKHIVSNNSGSCNEMSSSFEGVATEDQSHLSSRKTSNIPVFSQSRNSVKASNHINDKIKLNSVLTDVVYKEQENVCPNSPVVSQDYCKQRGSIIVKGVNNEYNEVPHQLEAPLKDTSNFSSCKHPSEKENGRTLKDSIIVNHFQMQKKHEHVKEAKGKEELIPSNIPPTSKCDSNKTVSSKSKEHSSSENLPSVNDSKLPVTENRPSSCLKVPGSPSLKAKHVTFAHKLVHHQNNEVLSAVHNSQDKTSMRYQLFSQSSRPSQASSQETHLDSIVDKEGRMTGISRSPSLSQPMRVEESDLQVVPCREGDTQLVTTTVSVQGSKTLSAVSSYGSPASFDKNRADLIMAFSWMNQTSGYDTPCVSYIESKQGSMESSQESNGNSTSSDSASLDIKKAFIDPSSAASQKKSRKFRSRLAANFSLK